MLLSSLSTSLQALFQAAFCFRLVWGMFLCLLWAPRGLVRHAGRFLWGIVVPVKGSGDTRPQVRPEIGTGVVCALGSLTEDRERNKELRWFCGLLLGSRAGGSGARRCHGSRPGPVPRVSAASPVAAWHTKPPSLWPLFLAPRTRASRGPRRSLPVAPLGSGQRCYGEAPGGLRRGWL
jgi:hypothetical protein